MSLYSPADLVPLVLGGATFYLKPASHLEEAHWRSDIEDQGVRSVAPQALAARAHSLVESYCPEEAKADLHALLDSELTRTLASRDGEVVDPAPAEVDTLYATLCDIDPVYARDSRFMQRWLALAPVLAAYRFLRGWDGSYNGAALPAVRHLPNGAVLPSLIDQLPSDVVAACGWKIIDLLQLSRSAEKNSSPPSSSPASPATLPGRKRAPTAAAG